MAGETCSTSAPCKYKGTSCIDGNCECVEPGGACGAKAVCVAPACDDPKLKTGMYAENGSSNECYNLTDLPKMKGEYSYLAYEHDHIVKINADGHSNRWCEVHFNAWDPSILYLQGQDGWNCTSIDHETLQVSCAAGHWSYLAKDGGNRWLCGAKPS